MEERIEHTPILIRVLDTTTHAQTASALIPFAYEEIIGRDVGNGELPLIHLWRHERAFIMGLRDRKLPFATEAMAWLERQGYKTIVRHSGGAAVPLDSGVVNVSLIMPKTAHHMNFRQDFQKMVSFLQACLQPYTSNVQSGEIIGSYCPGDYDLSIKGQKFCGISQRRQTRSLIVQAFVIVEGSGSERARLVQDFYRIASGDKRVPGRLEIEPFTMASLSELIQLTSVSDFTEKIKRTIATTYKNIAYSEVYDPTFAKKLEQMMLTLQQRYDR